jgi:hypothetical protein
MGYYGQNIMRLVKLLSTICITAHVSGCFWHYIAATEVPEESALSWTVRELNALGVAAVGLCCSAAALIVACAVYGVVNAETNVRWMSSVYFAMVTLMTVGYGYASSVGGGG